MKKEDFIKLGLDEETAKKAAEASSKELEGFIPKSRFDTVNEAKKNAEEQVKNYDKQLKDLKKSAKGNEDLEKQIKELQEANETTANEYKEKMEKLKLETAVDLAFGVLNETKRKAAKAFVDREKLSFSEDGEVVGLKEQVEDLKKSEETSFLYDQPGKKFKGVEPGEGDDPNKGNEPTTLADAIRAGMKK